MKLRALFLLAVFSLMACAPAADTDPNQASNLDNVPRYTPLIAYAVPVDQETVDNRTWQTVALYSQKMGQAPELLIDRIGDVGEYPGGFEFTPDKKELYVNLESRLVAINLASKEIRDVFVPNKQVLSYTFVDDGASILVWDQEYATQDFEYFVHRVNTVTGEAEQLHQGDADGKYFFINKLSDEGDLLLFQAAGEAAAPWTFDLETFALEPVPGFEEPRTFIGFSEGGGYVVSPDQVLEDVCNDFFGSSPSVYAYADVETGEMVGTVGDPTTHMQIIAMSPDDTEVLYADFVPPETAEDCTTVPDAFYRASIGGGEPQQVENEMEIFAEWSPDEAGLDYEMAPDGGSMLSYYGTKFAEFSVDKYLVATTVLE